MSHAAFSVDALHLPQCFLLLRRDPTLVPQIPALHEIVKADPDVGGVEKSGVSK